MSETMFNPPASLKPRIAAEEYQPWTGRGIVWGSVHDENAYCVGGVSGHAGVFSTADDLAVLAQTLLNGGQYEALGSFTQHSVRALFTDYNQAFPTHAHGLGFELDQRRYMGALSSPVTAGHTGFTGTSIVIDPLAHSFVILLTNRVHPSRSWGADNPPRAAVATDLAMAPPVRPTRGPTAWFAGAVDDTTATLTVPVAVPAGTAELSFDLWYDTAETDGGALQASSDGGATWQLVPLSLRVGSDRWQTDGTFTGFEGRQWLRASAHLNPLTTHVRWIYTTGSAAHGRGVYVDAVVVNGAQGTIFDDSRPADAAQFQPDEWMESGSRVESPSHPRRGLALNGRRAGGPSAGGDSDHRPTEMRSSSARFCATARISISNASTCSSRPSSGARCLDKRSRFARAVWIAPSIAARSVSTATSRSAST